MTQYLLFRKLVIKGKKYYQFYGISKEKPSSDFIDIDSNVEDSGKISNYYILEKSGNYSNIKYKMILKDDFRSCPKGKEYRDVLEEFGKYYKDFSFTLSCNYSFLDTNSLNLNDEIMFQEEAIPHLLDFIKLNHNLQSINPNYRNRSDIHSNILLIGPQGCGKNTTIDVLKEHLTVPYADIVLNPNLIENIALIGRQLVSSAKVLKSNISDEEISDFLKKGIVFIRDNFDYLENSIDPELGINGFIKSIHSEEYFYDNKSIDFSNLTFITTSNIYELDIEQVEEELQFTGCDVPIIFQKLSENEIKEIILKSKNSRFNVYKKLLALDDKKLTFKKGVLEYLIKETYPYDMGVDAINNFLDGYIKSMTTSSLNNIVITKSDVEIMLENLFGKSEETPTLLPVKEQLDKEKIISEIKAKVFSQDEHIKRIVNRVIKNFKHADIANPGNHDKLIKNILIHGESGSGKSAILNELARILQVPIVIVDITKYTEAGYIGKDIDEMLVSLVNRANGDVEKAQKGILVIDEIDKKATTNKIEDISRAAVLNGLLKLTEGSKMDINIGSKQFEKMVTFDTSHLTVICSGAFEGIEEIRDERLGKKKMGFGTKMEPKKDIDYSINYDDFIAYGMEKQFMARFPVIVNLNKLTVEDLKKIMKESPFSDLNIEKEEALEDGVEYIFEEEFYDELAKKAKQKNIGARGIPKVFEDILNLTGVDSIDPTMYKQVIFTGECVNDPSKIILVPKEKKLIKK